jgi:stage II sporulation protein AA (anti-sigma F factor antagonist)
MEDSTDKGLRRDATGDHVAGLADHRLPRMNLQGHAGTRVEPAPAPFEVRRVDHPLGVVLTLGGELDLATVALLHEQLDRAMRGRRAVVIDLSGLQFIDSSGLHVLMRAERELRAAGGQLVLVYGSRAVHRVFELTGLDHYFAWHDSPTAALRTAVERRNGSRGSPARRQPTDRGRSLTANSEQ